MYNVPFKKDFVKSQIKISNKKIKKIRLLNRQIIPFIEPILEEDSFAETTRYIPIKDEENCKNINSLKSSIKGQV